MGLQKILTVYIDRFLDRKSPKRIIEELEVAEKIHNSKSLSKTKKQFLNADLYYRVSPIKLGRQFSNIEAANFTEKIITPSNGEFGWKSINSALPYFKKHDGYYTPEIFLTKKHALLNKVRAASSIIIITLGIISFILISTTAVNLFLDHTELKSVKERLVLLTCLTLAFFIIGYLIFREEYRYTVAQRIHRFLSTSKS